MLVIQRPGRSVSSWLRNPETWGRDEIESTSLGEFILSFQLVDGFKKVYKVVSKICISRRFSEQHQCRYSCQIKYSGTALR